MDKHSSGRKRGKSFLDLLKAWQTPSERRRSGEDILPEPSNADLVLSELDIPAVAKDKVPSRSAEEAVTIAAGVTAGYPVTADLAGEINAMVAVLASPSVTTDKPDYRPGEEAVITASGFQPGDTITFAIADDPQHPGDDGDADVYAPFSVTDGGAGDEDGVMNGTVVTSWQIPTDDDGSGTGTPDALNATVQITAQGSDGQMAVGSFTDALPPTANLTFANSEQTINGAIFSSAVFNAGTGLIDPFLNIQATGTEQGYNTDNGTPLDTKDPNTTALQVSSVPIAYIGATPYLEFRLDINENINKAGDQFLSLDALKIYLTNNNNLTGFTPAGPSGNFPDGAATLVYDLDATGDNWVGLNAALQPGSGYGDISVFVPASSFYTDASLTTPKQQYITLYSAFGYQGSTNDLSSDYPRAPQDWTSSDGFEEWSRGKGVALQTSKITGSKFYDANGNGLFDAGDKSWTPANGFLAPVTIYLDQNDNGQLDLGELFTTTDASGNYTFADLVAGLGADSVYRVREVVPTGYIQTAPLTGLYATGVTGENAEVVDRPGDSAFDPTIVIELKTAQVTYALPAFGNYRNFSISGYKYTDVNGDGSLMGDSPGTPGQSFTIELYSFTDLFGDGLADDGENLTFVKSTETNAATGFWSFDNLGPLGANGFYLAKEVGESGWTQTFGKDGYTVAANSGNADSTGNNFGNFELFDISGYKFIDIVGDGVWGPVDPNVPNGDKDPGEKGWTINLSVDADKSGTFNAGDTFIASDVTDETGQYQFTDLGPLKPGEQYIVWESPFPEGDTALDWTQTFNTPGYYLFDPVSGQSFAGVEGSSVLDEDGEGPGKGNFGNFKNLDLGCYKWIDTNGNSAWDEGEAGANGWVIYLDNDEDLSNGFIRTVTTATEAGTGYEGFYEFQNITPEEIDGALTLYVYEEIRPGFVKTFGGYTFDVQSGEIVRSDYGIAQTGNFGNFELFDISGTKFTDTNGDGLIAGDSGLDGVTIFIDKDGSGSLNAGDLSTITANGGLWSFTGLDYNYAGLNVFELLPDGYTQTLGTAGYGITGTSGTNQENLNFANFELFDISGYKFIDIVGDGVWGPVDPLDPGSDKDPGEKGWTINLSVDTDKSGTFNAGDTLIASDVTDETGQYQFTDLGPLKPGQQYIVWESPFPEGDTALDWTQTFNTPGYYLFDPVSGQSFAGVEGSSVLDEDGEGPGKGNFGNFKNLDLGCYKWIDTNGNSAWDEGEAGANGWVIYLDNDEDLSNGFIRTVTTATEAGTGYEGFYEFQNITPEEIDGALTLYVYEEIRPGFVKTFGGYTFDVQSGEIVRSDYGIAQTGNFGNFELFDISGTKFTDTNGDGLIAGDSGLDGVTIFIDKDGSGSLNAGDLSTITANGGLWSFTGLDYNYAGLNVFELLPDGYTQTLGTAGYGITGTSGTNQENLNFANFELFDISGTKFTDTNGDGLIAGDSGLDGVTIFIDKDGSGSLNAGDLSTITANGGLWSFTGLDYNYAGLNVFELLPDGYTQTLGTAGYGITGTSGTNQENLNFANFELFDISGTKFTDTNGDGLIAGDSGLDGVTIFIDKDGSGSLNAGDLSTITANGGLWSFTGLDYNYAGLNVFELLPDGYTQTLGTAGYGITGTSGTNQENLNFANFELFDISGTKFTDTNGDGLIAGDSGLDGVTIFIDKDGSGSLNAGDLSTITANGGLWSFTGLDYNYAGLNVFELLPDGYTQTLGTAGYGITGTSGTNQENLNFANFELFDISGTKFTDLDADGKREDGELGLGDVTIYIDNDESGTLTAGDLSTKTALDGTWSFSNLDYTLAGKKVYEILPSGYAQTLGMAGYEIIGTSGADQSGLDFGNVRVGACGLTPGFWLGGAANPKVKGKITTSIWDGIANNDGGKLATLRGTISDVVIDLYGDVLLTPEFTDNNVVKKMGTGYAADSYQNPVTADFALGIEGSLRDFNNDGKLDQIYIEHFDARKILGTAYQPGDRFGALLRKDLAMILDVAGQQDYVQVTELRSAIYDWVGDSAFNAVDNFAGSSGDGILTRLEDPSNLGNNDYDVNNDNADDWVINYQAASNKKSAGFGADGTFTVLGTSPAWTTGGDTLPTPPDDPETTYSGQVLFDVLSAQFEGSCNLDVTLDGTHVLTQDANGLTNGIYENNGNLSMIASTLPSYGI